MPADVIGVDQTNHCITTKPEQVTWRAQHLRSLIHHPCPPRPRVCGVWGAPCQLAKPAQRGRAGDDLVVLGDARALVSSVVPGAPLDLAVTAVAVYEAGVTGGDLGLKQPTYGRGLFAHACCPSHAHALASARM